MSERKKEFSAKVLAAGIIIGTIPALLAALFTRDVPVLVAVAITLAYGWYNFAKHKDAEWGEG